MMQKINKLAGLALFFYLVLVPSAMAYDQDEPQSQGSVLVGRISYVTGQLLRYVPEEKDWVATVKDAPFGLNDALYSGDDTHAEFIIPNGTWVRIGNNSQIQLITAEDDFTEIDVASGMVRFYNKSTDGMIKATTPFGYVLAPAETSFDLYVGDNSVEVIAVDGKVDFIPGGGNAKYPVSAGGPSVLADSRQVSSGEGIVDHDWDAFNAERELIWARRLHAGTDSITYLPERLHDEAYVLDENGQWENVYYGGEIRRLWRPVRVGSGWAPFTHGHWTVWYEDNCWIPDEEFGYVTHHYGNWIYVNHYWYWAPPLARVDVAVSSGHAIGFGWYPGRVSWIHSGVYVGWVPLAPYEPYYCHRYWGPRSHRVAHVEVRNINISQYSYYNHAVIVNQTNFYGIADYNSVRVRNIKNINHFRPAPVVSNTVVTNYNNMTKKYNYTNTPLTRKPHDSVMQRIRYNERAARQSANLTGKTVRQESMRIKPALPAQNVRVDNPMVSNKLVAPDDVRKPKSEMNFPQTEMKSHRAVKHAPVQPGQTAPAGRAGHPQPPVQERREVQPPSATERTLERQPSTQAYPPVQQPSLKQYRKGPQPPVQGHRETPPPSVREQAPEAQPQRYPQDQQPSPQQRRNEPPPPAQQRRQEPPPSVEPQANEPQAPMSRPSQVQPLPSQQHRQTPQAPVEQPARQYRHQATPPPSVEQQYPDQQPSPQQRRNESPPPAQQRRQEPPPSVEPQANEPQAPMSRPSPVQPPPSQQHRQTPQAPVEQPAKQYRHQATPPPSVEQQYPDQQPSPQQRRNEPPPPAQQHRQTPQAPVEQPSVQPHHPAQQPAVHPQPQGQQPQQQNQQNSQQGRKGKTQEKPDPEYQ